MCRFDITAAAVKGAVWLLDAAGVHGSHAAMHMPVPLHREREGGSCH